MALELNQSKHRIYEYVESRMSFIAPNLSIIVGASTAAKLMGRWGFKRLQIYPFFFSPSLLLKTYLIEQESLVA